MSSSIDDILPALIRFDLVAFSDFTHPHDVVFPDFRFDVFTATFAPQSHMQFITLSPVDPSLLFDE